MSQVIASDPHTLPKQTYPLSLLKNIHVKFL